jgi:hypothetical protein
MNKNDDDHHHHHNNNNWDPNGWNGTTIREKSKMQKYEDVPILGYIHIYPILLGVILESPGRDYEKLQRN